MLMRAMQMMESSIDKYSEARQGSELNAGSGACVVLAQQ